MASSSRPVPAFVCSADEAAAKGGAPGGTPKGGTPGAKKKRQDLSEEEKRKIKEFYPGRACPMMAIRGSCSVGSSCRYSHDRDLCRSAIETECRFGGKCVKKGQLLRGKEYGGWPSCVHLHDGKKCIENWREPTKKVDQISVENAE